MRNAVIGLAASALVLGGAFQAFGQEAEAPAQLVFGVDRAGEIPSPTLAQFVYSGHQYCWYGNGWKGAGFYWCGYAWRHGFGLVQAVKVHRYNEVTKGAIL